MVAHEHSSLFSCCRQTTRSSPALLCSALLCVLYSNPALLFGCWSSSPICCSCCCPSPQQVFQALRWDIGAITQTSGEREGGAETKRFIKSALLSFLRMCRKRGAIQSIAPRCRPRYILYRSYIERLLYIIRPLTNSSVSADVSGFSFIALLIYILGAYTAPPSIQSPVCNISLSPASSSSRSLEGKRILIYFTRSAVGMQ